MKQIICKKCGIAFSDTRRTCPNCGAKSTSENRPQPRRRVPLNADDTKAQWKALTSTLVGMVIAGGLCTLVNDGTFNFLITLLLYLLGYYISAVKKFLGFHSILGTIVAVALTGAAMISVGIFAEKYMVIGTIILLALFALPFARGVVMPVYTLVRCKLDRC